MSSWMVVVAAAVGLAAGVAFVARCIWNPAKKAEKMKEKNEASIVGATVAAVGVAAGVALVAHCLRNLAKDPEPETEEEKKKMMKAPGRENYKIPRDEFEKNPRDYFRDLHVTDKITTLENSINYPYCW
ncbi:Uncharacterized protein Fot_15841 [Forsythia ovata]|uniref:Uncharacterized protein n=1 Tax=Forsythia ovata TaxID=205694 RepID=A0ABD1WCQ0_9LAMI